MSNLREAYRRLAGTLLKQALRERDFGFVDSPLGQLALAIIDDGDKVLAAFRKAEDACVSTRRTGRRLTRTAVGMRTMKVAASPNI